MHMYTVFVSGLADVTVEGAVAAVAGRALAGRHAARPALAAPAQPSASLQVQRELAQSRRQQEASTTSL